MPLVQFSRNIAGDQTIPGSYPGGRYFITYHDAIPAPYGSPLSWLHEEDHVQGWSVVSGGVPTALTSSVSPVQVLHSGGVLAVRYTEPARPYYGYATDFSAGAQFELIAAEPDNSTPAYSGPVVINQDYTTGTLTYDGGFAFSGPIGINQDFTTYSLSYDGSFAFSGPIGVNQDFTTYTLSQDGGPAYSGPVPITTPFPIITEINYPAASTLIANQSPTQRTAGYKTLQNQWASANLNGKSAVQLTNVPANYLSRNTWRDVAAGVLAVTFVGKTWWKKVPTWANGVEELPAWVVVRDDLSGQARKETTTRFEYGDPNDFAPPYVPPVCATFPVSYTTAFAGTKYVSWAQFVSGRILQYYLVNCTTGDIWYPDWGSSGSHGSCGGILGAQPAWATGITYSKVVGVSMYLTIDATAVIDGASIGIFPFEGAVTTTVTVGDTCGTGDTPLVDFPFVASQPTDILGRISKSGSTVTLALRGNVPYV